MGGVLCLRFVDRSFLEAEGVTGGAVFLRFRASWVVFCAQKFEKSRKTGAPHRAPPPPPPVLVWSVVGHARLDAGSRLLAP